MKNAICTMCFKKKDLIASNFIDVNAYVCVDCSKSLIKQLDRIKRHYIEAIKLYSERNSVLFTGKTNINLQKYSIHKKKEIN